MAFNGPERELPTTPTGEVTEDERAYCHQCGSMFIRAPGRSCPACTLAEMLEGGD